MIKMAILFAVPSLSKYISIASMENQTKFFEELAIGLVAQKRAELAKGNGGFEKASSFIEFVLEAEAENKKLEGEIEDSEVKKPTKCK